MVRECGDIFLLPNPIRQLFSIQYYSLRGLWPDFDKIRLDNTLSNVTAFLTYVTPQQDPIFT